MRGHAVRGLMSQVGRLLPDSCQTWQTWQTWQTQTLISLMFFSFFDVASHVRLCQKFYPDEISLSLGVPGDLATSDIDGSRVSTRGH